MATYYLGGEFDIHCGGLDLQFPHHENEAAQSHAAGDGFARYWLHNHWVTMAGEKMSKSLGNVLSVPHILTLVRPVELRYYLGSAHYRSVLEYSEEALHEAAAGYRRIEDFLRRLGEVEAGTRPETFDAAMNEDLSVPRALAEIHTAVRAGNSALAAGEEERAREIGGQVRAMTSVLGIDPYDWAEGQTGAGAELHEALDILVQAELERRAQARAEKNWAVADEVRDRLAAAGVEVTDTPEGPQWSLRARN